MKYDLLLTGGDVLDPAAGLRGLMDIGIAGGKIRAVAPSLPAADAKSQDWLAFAPQLFVFNFFVFVTFNAQGAGEQPIARHPTG